MARTMFFCACLSIFMRNQFLEKNKHNKQQAQKTHDKIANKFNEFFINVGPKLASKIPSSTKTHSSYLDTCDTLMSESELTIKELLFHHYSQTKVQGLTILVQFSDQLKIARVTPIFKENSDGTNYRPISVLPCFSKVLERIMHNRLYDQLVQNNILYDKQFGFQKHHSTNHAVIELVSELSESFNKRLFTLGIFIDLSKAFDTVNHNILLSKLKSYGVQNNNLKWFTNYLTNRKQCIAYDDKLTLFQLIKCGAQGSILGPLLFLIYINNLLNSFKMLRFILFADDTNLFYSHTNIVDLFKTANQELAHINEWFKANKLSLNISKTKYVLFYNRYKTDKIPLLLYHLLKILTYLTYCNISWASNNVNKLKKLYNKQKHACRIIFGSDRYAPTQHLFLQIGALNIYQLNMHQVLLFMYKMKQNITPKLFTNQFSLTEKHICLSYNIDVKNYYNIPVNLCLGYGNINTIVPQ
ncbi:uncharacterized protein LOC130636892 [Hydractinia symbiolongicarpus]|uniref:uncharacterized protein LOC130636892 n=1 Tax=Hydractinia symbiolongicarpus TaxID=13093 RepID=UPI00255015BE|nr:uncharacterized protein LOC130636892 [Hydractinia symbiolongicarpus]